MTFTKLRKQYARSRLVARLCLGTLVSCSVSTSCVVYTKDLLQGGKESGEETALIAGDSSSGGASEPSLIGGSPGPPSGSGGGFPSGPTTGVFPSDGPGTGGAHGETGGTGGMAVVGTPIRCDLRAAYSELDMIADMSLPGNMILATADGRNGFWFAHHGASILPSPLPNEEGIWPARPMSKVLDEESDDYAVHYTTEVTGSDLGEQWHQFGFYLKATQTGYDASAFNGIVFCARSSLRRKLGIRLSESRTSREVRVELDASEWAAVEVPFPDDLNSTDLKIVDFVGETGENYDLWIDNIAFYQE